ncbi:MAG: flagellar filament capping protein FliD [Planctomycetota bacterium]
MGRIQSNVGLITGIPITDTIEQLLNVSAQPRDQLTARTQGLQQEQVAINTLSSRVLSLKFDLDRLKVSDPFQARAVTSSQPDILSAVLSGDSQPQLGSFALQPAQLASSQQLISQRFESVDDIQNAGVFSFGFGGFVDKGISLDELNSGEGVARGEIKITDLAGNSSIVDLSLARSVDDVIQAINNDTTVNVTASADGDSFTLVDTIGGSGTVSVQDVKGGTTAADLGLTLITTSTLNDEVSGADVFGLHSGTKLTALNDGNGVYFTDDVETVSGEEFPIDDLVFTFRDDSLDSEGNKFGVDLTGATTVGDVVDAINNDADLSARVSASISSDGNRLQLQDLTSDGGGSFTVDNGTTGTAAEDLGLKIAAAGDTITGERLISGLRDTLTSSLNGGQGLGDLGTIEITDRNGTFDEVDLSTATTLDEIVDLINASTANVAASVNEARSGIVIQDASGGTGNLIIADDDLDGLTTATTLGIAIDAEQSSVDSGSLDRQTLSRATLLSSLNGGEGITASDIRIFDSSQRDTSNGARIDLNASDNTATTIGDVIDAINASSADVTASINAKGDGILITDNGSGSGTLRIEDVNGTLGDDLNLTGASQTVDNAQVIDGTTSYSVDLSTISTSSTSISLDSLNDGTGIGRGDVIITDSNGKKTALDLNGLDSAITTVEQLIDAINAGNADVTASLTESGTGIQLTDNANGPGNLIVEDVNGTTAADLNILSTDNTTTSITSNGLFTSLSDSQGALNNVATQINNLESGVTASVLNDGQGFRLQIVVDDTGSANEILFDAGDSGFNLTETSSAQDALLIVGGGSVAGSGVLVSSSTNEFKQVIDGVDLTATATSETAVDVTISESDQEIVDLVQSFVESYNTLRDDLGELTSFNEDDLSTGLLFGTNEALRVDVSLSRLVTERYSGLGEFDTLQDIGISIDDTGKLSLDQSALREAFDTDSQSLQRLFTSEESGVVDRFNNAIDRLTDAETGLLTNRDESLQATIDLNNARIERFNESLERERTRLELEFFNLELLISNLQTSQEAVNSIQGIPALTSTSS